MSCTFNRIGPESRQYPLNRPEGWKVKYPRWTLKLPANINEVVIAYIGVQPPRTVPCEKGVYMNLHQHSVEESQRRAASVLEAWVTDDSATDAPNLWEKFYVETGYDVPDTEVWVLYWINRFSAESALSKLDLQHISPSSSSDTASMVGIWRESFTIPRERFETIYSGNDYQPGIASLEDSLQVSHEFTGYWGAARDRIPASSHSNFLPQHPAPIPDFAKHTKNRALRGYNRDVLLHIRSGQYWERCSREEREAYESALEPLLRKGMAYLEDNAAETGDFGLRFMRNIIPNRRLRGETMVNTNRTTSASPSNGEACNGDSPSRKRLETCSAGFFRSLKDLESWAAKHRTHQKIFQGVHAHSLRFGKETYKLRTWHEVSILNPGEVEFEYVNCDPRTGLLPFVEIEEDI